MQQDRYFINVSKETLAGIKKKLFCIAIYFSINPQQYFIIFSNKREIKTRPCFIRFRRPLNNFLGSLIFNEMSVRFAYAYLKLVLGRVCSDFRSYTEEV